MENLLINPDTLKVKLIDFGCGDFLTKMSYTSFAGTRDYCPPEYLMTGEYHGEPATVSTKDNECCDMIRCCLQIDPKQRTELEKLSLHSWFKIANKK
ncbi:serine threonine- kinase pim-2-like protein [Labeo rohita]|uniref:non-specific serine/threonine protein kinase n=1 Tax=Labeo rohita TaxID=84645 RepID=A0A498N063_LABRO|nr:serine threonine- kinase pim-2-like protein [Labeo rohita]